MSSSSERQLNETEREMLKSARTKGKRVQELEAAFGLSPGNKHSLPTFVPGAGIEDWKKYRERYDLITWNDQPDEEESSNGDQAEG